MGVVRIKGRAVECHYGFLNLHWIGEVKKNFLGFEPFPCKRSNQATSYLIHPRLFAQIAHLNSRHL